MLFRSKLLNALSTFQSAAKSQFNIGASPSLAAKDPVQITKNITNLVSQYNTLSASLSGLQKGDLKADGSVQRIQSQLDRIFKSATSGTAGGSYISPGSIGITTKKMARWSSTRHSYKTPSLRILTAWPSFSLTAARGLQTLW